MNSIKLVYANPFCKTQLSKVKKRLSSMELLNYNEELMTSFLKYIAQWVAYLLISSQIILMVINPI